MKIDSSVIKDIKSQRNLDQFFNMVTCSYVCCNILIIPYQRNIPASISLLFHYISDAARKLFFITEEKTYYVTTLGRKNRNSLITDISLSSCCITKTLSPTLLVPYFIYTSLVLLKVSRILSSRFSFGKHETNLQEYLAW